MANSFPGASQSLSALFPIQQQGKWGFIDRTGKVAVPPQFEHAMDFHGGRAGVKVGNKFGFVDETGKVVIPPQFDKVPDFAGGLAGVEIGGKWGFVDPNGKMVISPRFTAVGTFSEGRAPVRQKGKWGFIDASGALVVPCQYVEVGKIVIPPQFQSAEQFSEGLALVASPDYKYAFINRAGKIVIPPPNFKPVDFGPEEPGSRFSGGLAPVQIGEKCGFVDRKGKLVIPPQFLNARNFSEGLAAVEVCSGAASWCGRPPTLVTTGVNPLASETFSTGPSLTKRMGRCKERLVG